LTRKCELTVVREDCPNPATVRIVFPGEHEPGFGTGYGCDECTLRMAQISESFHEVLRTEPIA
jgi:hypothetical protein